MSYKVEVVGGVADRFRAYGEVKMLRSPTAADHIKRHEAGLAPLEPGAKIRFTGEDVVLEGDVSGQAVSINAEQPIVCVVFYKGPIESEAVCGSVEIGALGAIAIELVAAPDVVAVADEAAERQVVDEI